VAALVGPCLASPLQTPPAYYPPASITTCYLAHAAYGHTAPHACARAQPGRRRRARAPQQQARGRLVEAPDLLQRALVAQAQRHGRVAQAPALLHLHHRPRQQLRARRRQSGRPRCVRQRSRAARLKSIVSNDTHYSAHMLHLLYIYVCKRKASLHSRVQYRSEGAGGAPLC